VVVGGATTTKVQDSIETEVKKAGQSDDNSDDAETPKIAKKKGKLDKTESGYAETVSSSTTISENASISRIEETSLSSATSLQVVKSDATRERGNADRGNASSQRSSSTPLRAAATITQSTNAAAAPFSTTPLPRRPSSEKLVTFAQEPLPDNNVNNEPGGIDGDNNEQDTSSIGTSASESTETSETNPIVLKAENFINGSLLSRQFTVVLPAATMLYFLLQFVNGFWASMTNFEPICNVDSKELAEFTWVYNSYLAVSSCFLVGLLMQTIRLLQGYIAYKNVKKERRHIVIESQCVHAASFTIHLMSGSSTLLTSVYEWGGVCRDGLGVYSHAAMWPEWLITVPLLVYIAMSVESKPHLKKIDYFIITCMALCILSGQGILLIDPASIATSWLMFGAGVFALIVAVVCWTGEFIPAMARMGGFIVDTETVESEEEIEKKQLCANLVVILFIFTPTFAMIYALGALQVITPTLTLMGFVIMGMTAKLVFLGVMVDAHIGVRVNKVVATLNVQQKMNEVRRAFLRNVFHEVRVPLSTITMGIDIIEASGALHGNVECQDAIDMMMEASSFVCDTLNDVLSMNKIEEGKMVFELAPFDIRAMISRVVMVANGQAAMKNLRILVNIDPLLNAHVVSDRFRIEHVLANLISNAIKFSRPNTVIGVDVEVVPYAAIPRSTSDTVIADPMMASTSSSSSSSSYSSQTDMNNEANNNGTSASNTNTSASSTKSSSSRTKSGKQKTGSGGSRKREKREKVVLAYRFTVSDHGPGITNEDIAKLFKPFSQINPSIIQVFYHNIPTKSP